MPSPRAAFLRFRSWSSVGTSAEITAGFLLAALVFVVYLTTLAPGLGFTDAGELAVVAATMGVAHPTGYPLFTFLSGAIAALPAGVFGTSVVWRLNLLAALCTAASVFFFFRVFLAIRGASRNREAGSRDIPAAAGGALALAFSRVFWEQSTGVEVYSLHLLLVSLTLHFFARAVLRPRVAAAGADSSGRAWRLFAYCLGLSFANHLTTVLLLPALAWGAFARRRAGGFGRASGTAVLRALPPFLLGLTPYLYLPVRAAASPFFNWGDPSGPAAFWRHVTGRQYRNWMFSSLDGAWTRLAEFFTGLPEVLGVVAIVLLLLGAAAQAVRAPRFFGFTFLLFAACVVYAVNYDIHDVSSYFLLAYVACGAWVAAGTRAAAGFISAGREKEGGKGRGRFFAGLALAAVCAVAGWGGNRAAVDRSRDHAVEDYARNMLGPLEPGAVLLSVQWDLFVSAAWYLQRVEGFRPDVAVIDRELLRRSWYVAGLSRRHPGLAAGAAPETDAFLEAVRPFEAGEPYDAGALQAAYENLIRALVRTALRTRPLYFGPEIADVIPPGHRLVPTGLAFRLQSETEPPAAPWALPFNVRPVAGDGLLYREVRERYGTAAYNRAWAQGAAGDLDQARESLREALRFRPGFGPAARLLQRLDATAPDP